MFDFPKRLTDQKYLQEDQYKNAANLSARANLHVQFSTNKQGLFAWLFERMDIPSPARILEIGAGPAWFWDANAARIPAGWDITLSDFSAGMLDEARATLHSLSHPFHFEQIDAQQIPYADGTFDTVIANFMMYHVPDRPKALGEIRRVLKPGGKLIVSTNGENHMRETYDLMAKFSDDGEHPVFSTRTFSLENAPEQLQPFFSTITLHRYPDRLAVTEAPPLVDYLLSSLPRHTVADEWIARMTRYVEQQIAASGGVYTITKDSGVFIARRD
jgi:ubiquinone/menaquinone biosynthesis C-methylase UbiE